MTRNESPQDLRICQVAISGRRTFAEAERWYVEGLGFEAAGGADFAGPDQAGVAGIDVPTLDTRLDWLVGRDEFFQLEYFSFREPETRPKRDDWTVADVGYNVVGVHVMAFDDTLERLAVLGSVPVGAVVGVDGDRRAVVLDPNGVVFELMERDIAAPAARPPVRPEGNPAVRFVRATVADLGRSRRFFVETLGLEPVSTELHSPQQEAALGVGEAPVDSEVVAAGGCFVELVQYAEGVARERPQDFRISDEGILNVACGSVVPGPVREARDRVHAGPYAVHDDVRAPEFELNYVTDDQGFSVELLYIGASKHVEFGFV